MAGASRPASRALPGLTMPASDNWSERDCNAADAPEARGGSVREGASLSAGLEAAKKSCKQSVLQHKSCHGGYFSTIKHGSPFEVAFVITFPSPSMTSGPSFRLTG